MDHLVLRYSICMEVTDEATFGAPDWWMKMKHARCMCVRSGLCRSSGGLGIISFNEIIEMTIQMLGSHGVQY